MKTKHRWKGTDVPNYYICDCGAIGVWNNELDKVEVAQPIPDYLYLERHVAEKDTN